MAVSHVYSELTVVPRIAVTFPLPLPPPVGFDPASQDTWPKIDGRLEYVEGRLLFMAPCGDRQQQTSSDIVAALVEWRDRHPDYVVGGNEAGMLLGGEVRAADAAVWRRADLGAASGGFPRVAPILAVEVTGRDESVDALEQKVRWYLERGVEVVWLADPEARRVRVVTSTDRVDVALGGRIPSHVDLPGLDLAVADLFRQVSGL